jgi:hypothetical protein
MWRDPFVVNLEFIMEVDRNHKPEVLHFLGKYWESNTEVIDAYLSDC